MQIIGGIHKHRRLKAPKGKSIRPSSAKLREAVFNMCQFRIEGSTFLDLFAGAGAIGLEALSRGASYAVFVDHNRHSQEAIQENIRLLKENDRAALVKGNVLQVLAKLDKAGKVFDMIFADPPYGTAEKSLSEEVLALIDTSGILVAEGDFFLEDDCDAVLSYRPKTLKLMSSRRMGRTLLRHFRKNQSIDQEQSPSGR